MSRVRCCGEPKEKKNLMTLREASFTRWNEKKIANFPACLRPPEFNVVDVSNVEYNDANSRIVLI